MGAPQASYRVHEVICMCHASFFESEECIFKFAARIDFNMESAKLGSKCTLWMDILPAEGLVGSYSAHYEPTLMMCDHEGVLILIYALLPSSPAYTIKYGVDILKQNDR